MTNLNVNVKPGLSGFVQIFPIPGPSFPLTCPDHLFFGMASFSKHYLTRIFLAKKNWAGQLQDKSILELLFQ
ncbi:hypothetical protein Halhy_1940 [Haliscomenobacter hydrossis DSM 1100]|uniref:Uncharacterized protein n=1 Tax=Haliscomenobacter hydrossis (strain ATCC 27775 / DSM 1100 / LMG 10767 / O) TaxID=760192 RepID=F4L6I2_HALH1|nr:hypothetical protein Halhy_1940 [Haliscomenobacter hydrossis DSM 1100]